MQTNNNYEPTLVLLLLLLCGDLVFILMHIAHVWTPWLNAAHYSLETDRGLPEMYQYIKLLWIVVCLFVMFLLVRRKTFLAWMGLFAFLLIDDATELHERVGYWLGVELGLPAVASLRPDDLGELLVAGVLGMLTLGLVAAVFWRGGQHTRQVTFDLLILIGLLAFFAVIVDVVHVAAYYSAPSVSELLALIEDGGEMLVVSLMTCYLFDVASQRGVPRFNLYRALRPAR